MQQFTEAILTAISKAKPSSTGGIKFIEITIALYGTSLRAAGSRMIDYQLQAARQAGLAVYQGRRDPRTGKPRKRWGWSLTPAGKRALPDDRS